jgi:phospholipase A1/A2
VSLWQLLVALLCLLALPLSAQESSDNDSTQPASLDACLLEALMRAPPDASVSALRQLCNPDTQTQRERNEHALRGRLALEEVSRLNPFVLTPHRRNYLLPFSYWSNPVSNNPLIDDGELQHQEIKFQVSLKAPLLSDFWNGYTAYFSFTAVSWMQLYNQQLSRPFRETNYEPEFFVVRPVNWQFGPIDSELISVGYWHQSNGRDVPTSRSWDRLFVSYVFRAGSWYVAIKPWWRIPENGNYPDTSPKRDDNPDIERYLGHFDLNIIKPMGNHVFELHWRNNLRPDNNKGSAQIDYSFPINSRFKGLLQAFTGYGDSLINYNDYQNRISIGILLTDTF